jgi:hypothetical protein
LLACAVDCLITLKMGDRKLPYQRLEFEIQNQRFEIWDARCKIKDYRLQIEYWTSIIESRILQSRASEM